MLRFGSVSTAVRILVQGSVFNPFKHSLFGIYESLFIDVEYTNEFKAWWDGLTASEQNDIVAVVELLAEHGSGLKFPYSSGIVSSRHAHMRELRVQNAGKPFRIFYAVDPRRTAILLIGDNKAGNDRFYRRFIPRADQLHDEHLQ